MLLAEAFVTFGVGNILLIIVGVIFLAMTVLAIMSGISSTSSNGTPLIFALAAATVVFGVLAPHWHTDNIVHGPQARADFRREYGGQIVKMSLTDHWANAHVKGCKPVIHHEMRRVHGVYWFAYGVEKTDSSGQSYTDYQPIPRQSIVSFCNSHTADGATVLALG